MSWPKSTIQMPDNQGPSRLQMQTIRIKTHNRTVKITLMNQRSISNKSKWPTKSWTTLLWELNMIPSSWSLTTKPSMMMGKRPRKMTNITVIIANNGLNISGGCITSRGLIIVQSIWSITTRDNTQERNGSGWLQIS
jgi:hypothetical protein